MADIKMSKEQFAAALECKTVDELIAYCKQQGYELEREDAEKFLAQNAEGELNIDSLENVAGGLCAGAISCGCLGIGFA